MDVQKVVDLDDEYVVIVVKNEGQSTITEIKEHAPEIKTELLEEEEYEDYSVDQLRSILNGSAGHGYPEVPVVVKEEINTDMEEEKSQMKEFYTEYEELYTDIEELDSNMEELDKDMEVLDTDNEEDELYEPIRTTRSKRKTTKYVSKRKYKGSKMTSFVENLIKKNPQLKEDKKGMISALLEKMHSIKPPIVEEYNYEVDKDKNYICLVCNYKNDYKPAFDRHYLEKHGPRYLYCFTCGTTFRSNTNLYKHERRCITPYRNVVLQARSLYVGLKSKHRPPLDVQIELPPKTKLHKVGGKKQEYPCTLCSATFKVKKSLEAHVLMHEGVRPYQCEQCSCAYTSQSKLTKHMYKHSDKLFICDHCKYEFKYKTALAAHLYTHYEPRFPCPECPRRYTHKAALQLHVHRHHRKLPPPCVCQMCPKRYNRMWYLKHHMKKVHGMQLITRPMFFKYLPTMADTMTEKAKLVMQSEAPAVHAKDLGALSDLLLQGKIAAETEKEEAPEKFNNSSKLNCKTGKLRQP